MMGFRSWSRAAAAFAVLAGLIASVGARAAERQTYTLKLTSPAFANGHPIPRKYTCDGADVSPPLAWNAAPAGTRSYALICDDPDAPIGTWVHWVIYGLPATATGLPEMVTPVETLPDGARQGLNDFHKVGYGGPCPPPGPAHHYQFKLYALDDDVPLPPRATMRDLLQAMAGHVLAEVRLMGTYQRTR